MTTEGAEEKHEDTEKALYRRGAEGAEKINAEMRENSCDEKKPAFRRKIT
jgi:hypothetical protein